MAWNYASNKDIKRLVHRLLFSSFFAVVTFLPNGRRNESFEGCAIFHSARLNFLLPSFVKHFPYMKYVQRLERPLPFGVRIRLRSSKNCAPREAHEGHSNQGLKREFISPYTSNLQTWIISYHECTAQNMAVCMPSVSFHGAIILAKLVKIYLFKQLLQFRKFRILLELRRS